MTIRRFVIAVAVLIGAVFASSASFAGAAASGAAPAIAINQAHVESKFIEVGRKGFRRGKKFRGGKAYRHRFGGRRFYRHKFGKRRYYRRGYKRRWRYRRWYRPGIVIAPYGYYYGGCYRRCRFYHGPRFCRRYWRRYC